MGKGWNNRHRLSVWGSMGIIFCCIICDLFADDSSFEQYLPGMVDQELLKDNKDNTEKSPFLTFDQDSKELEESEPGELPSPFIDNTAIPHKSIELNEKQKLNVKGNTLPGEFLTSKNYKGYSNKMILDEIRNKSKDRLTFFILHDTFDYKNKTHSFNRLYRDSKKIDVYGILLMAYDWYYSKGRFNILYGLGAGLGYNGGKGVFVGEDLSVPDSYTNRVQFNLYTIPLDLRLGTELALGRYLALGVFVGPSVLGIIEYRSDRRHSNREQNKVQVGMGYFSNIDLKILVGSIMQDLGLKLYSQNLVNQFSMNLEMRTHSYSRFKEKELAIGGTSFGLGFTYDFL